MKARKVETYSNLMNEILSQIKHFVPEPRMIKKQIEKLIELGYMERDPNDKTKLIYIP
jgi:cullin-4